MNLLMYANILTGFIETIRDLVVFGRIPDGLVIAWTMFVSLFFVLVRLLVLPAPAGCDRRCHLTPRS